MSGADVERFGSPTDVKVCELQEYFFFKDGRNSENHWVGITYKTLEDSPLNKPPEPNGDTLTAYPRRIIESNWSTICKAASYVCDPRNWDEFPPRDEDGYRHFVIRPQVFKRLKDRSSSTNPEQ